MAPGPRAPDPMVEPLTDDLGLQVGCGWPLAGGPSPRAAWQEPAAAGAQESQPETERGRPQTPILETLWLARDAGRALGRRLGGAASSALVACGLRLQQQQQRRPERAAAAAAERAALRLFAL